MPNIEMILISVDNKQQKLLEELYQEVVLQYLSILNEPIPEQAVLEAIQYVIDNSAFVDGFYFEGDVRNAVNHTILKALNTL